MIDIPDNITSDDEAFRMWVVTVLSHLYDKTEGHTHLESRIRKVENRLWWAVGSMGVIVGVISRIQL